MLGSLEIDPETGVSWNRVGQDNNELDKLDKVAPEESYEKLKEEVEHCETGDHLAWPDSFYEWYVPCQEPEEGVTLC